MLRRGVVLGVLAGACVLAMLAGLRAGSKPAVLLAAGPPLSLARPQAGGQSRLRAAQQMLADRPGAHIPQQILRNINGLWHKSISGKRSKNRKTGGFNLPKEVCASPRLCPRAFVSQAPLPLCVRGWRGQEEAALPGRRVTLSCSDVWCRLRRGGDTNGARIPTWCRRWGLTLGARSSCRMLVA